MLDNGSARLISTSSVNAGWKCSRRRPAAVADLFVTLFQVPLGPCALARFAKIRLIRILPRGTDHAIGPQDDWVFPTEQTLQSSFNHCVYRLPE
jgi:hypothetical protein